jgi:hypothetical protein
MSDDRPTLIHNGVGISDLETQDEYDWLMAGQKVPNKTSVSMQDEDHDKEKPCMIPESTYFYLVALAAIGSDPMQITITKCAPLRESVPALLGVRRSCLGARLF